MKKSFFSVPRTLPLHALTTFLIGVGCVWPLSLSLGLTAPLSLCLLPAAPHTPQGRPKARLPLRLRIRLSSPSRT